MLLRTLALLLAMGPAGALPAVDADPRATATVAAPVIVDADLRALGEIVAIARQGPGALPPTRADAAKRIGELMTRLSPKVLEALSPGLYYEIARMYWEGWGRDKVRSETEAKKYDELAVAAFKGGCSMERLSYQATCVNLSRSAPEPFIALMRLAAEVQAGLPVERVFAYYPLDRAIALRRLAMSDAERAEIGKAMREAMPQFVAVVTDGGTLKRFAGSREALQAIATGLAGSETAETAAGLLAKLPEKAP